MQRHKDDDDHHHENEENEERVEKVPFFDETFVEKSFVEALSRFLHRNEISCQTSLKKTASQSVSQADPSPLASALVLGAACRPTGLPACHLSPPTSLRVVNEV